MIVVRARHFRRAYIHNGHVYDSNVMNVVGITSYMRLESLDDEKYLWSWKHERAYIGMKWNFQNLNGIK